MQAQTLPQTSRIQATLVVLLLALVAALALGNPAQAGVQNMVRLAPIAAPKSLSHPLPASAYRLTHHRLELLKPHRKVAGRRLSPATVASLPASVDLRSWAPPSLNQGDLGSCVTWALDYGMLGWYERHDRGQAVDFNPMYTFSQVKQPDGEGGYYAPQPDTLNVAMNQGNDTIADYGSDFSNYWTTPTGTQTANAAKYKVTGARELFANPDRSGDGLTGQQLIQEQLASNHPVAIAIHVRPGFDALNYVGHTGYYDSDYSGAVRGNHEILAVAYDSYGLWILNSWGQGFGSNGLAELSWDVVQNDVFEAAVMSGFAAATTTDKTAPVMGAVSEQLAANGQVTSTTEPVTFSWSASDASGIAAFSVYVQKDGGTWNKDTALSATATSVTYALSIGHNYRVAVSAQDGAGNWSGYTNSVPVTPRMLDDKSFTASSYWTRYTLADAFNGTYVAAKTAGISKTLSFTGRDAAVVATEFSGAGKATIYCDGVAKTTIDLYSAATQARQVTAGCHFTTSAAHTMKVAVAGTSGRPWVAIDAFAYLS